MITWRVETVRERAHGETLRLDTHINGREIVGLIDRVFRLDQMADSVAAREKQRFDFRASRGPLTLSMTGLEWPPELISRYSEAEREAYERTIAEELPFGSLDEGESL